MKKILLVSILAATISLCGVALLGGSAQAATAPASCYTVSGGTIWDYSNDPGCPKDLDITETVSGETITSIGSYAFFENNLTSVTIPDSVTFIGAGAFRANLLTSVTIPDSVATLEAYAFLNNDLTSVTLSNSLTEIETSTFQDNALTSVIIPDSVTRINDYAFAFNALTSVTLSQNLTVINYAAFRDNQITSISFPNSVTTIGDFSFQNNQLASVDLPDGLTVLQEASFRNNRITSIDLPETLVTIEIFALFSNRLSTLTIPASVTLIDDQAVVGNHLRTVVIEGNPSLGDYTFARNGMDTSSTPWNVDDAEIVRFYPLDPAFAAAHPYEVYIAGSEMRGAFIANPAHAVVRYTDANDVDLTAARTAVGVESDGTPVTDYALSRLSASFDAANATADFSQFFLTGDTYSPEVLTFAGYISPSAQSRALDLGLNEFTYVYLTPEEAEEDAANGSGDAIDDAAAPSTPNTGLQMLGYSIIPLIGAVTLLAALLNRKRIIAVFTRK